MGNSLCCGVWVASILFAEFLTPAELGLPGSGRNKAIRHSFMQTALSEPPSKGSRQPAAGIPRTSFPPFRKGSRGARRADAWRQPPHAPRSARTPAADGRAAPGLRALSPGPALRTPREQQAPRGRGAPRSAPAAEGRAEPGSERSARTRRPSLPGLRRREPSGVRPDGRLLSDAAGGLLKPPTQCPGCPRSQGNGRAPRRGPLGVEEPSRSTRSGEWPAHSGDLFKRPSPR